MSNPLICLPYHSGNGHTRRLVHAIAGGMDAATPHVIDIEAIGQADWDQLDRAAAIVFATPTYMGSTSAAYAAFLEEAGDRWTDHGWADKLAAGATVATYPSGDKLATLQRLAVFAGQMGMLWIGQREIGAPVMSDRPGVNRDGSHLGLMATASRDKTALIDPPDLETAALFGARIAGAARRWG